MFKQEVAEKLNCAGQKCSEREGCKRFQVRAEARKVELPSGTLREFDWASFDLERSKLGGQCPHKILYVQHTKLKGRP